MKLEQEKKLHRVLGYYTYLLLVWGFFRLLFKFPELIEELWFKPVIWLLPLFWVWFTDKKRVSFFEGDFFRAVGWGLGLGVLYGAVAAVSSWGRFGVTNNVVLFEFVGLSLATAISEELAFTGYMFQRFRQTFGGLWSAAVTTGILFVLIHIPISIFVYKYTLAQMVSFLALVGVVEVVNCWLMARTRNVVAPILSHWLWGIAVFVFR